MLASTANASDVREHCTPHDRSKALNLLTAQTAAKRTFNYTFAMLLTQPTATLNALIDSLWFDPFYGAISKEFHDTAGRRELLARHIDSRLEPDAGETTATTTQVCESSEDPARAELAGIGQRWLESGAGDGNRTHGGGASEPLKQAVWCEYRSQV
jgi:hypothetical protein